MDELFGTSQDTSDQEQAFDQTSDAMDQQVSADLPRHLTSLPTEEPQLEVKVQFRQDEALRCFVTNQCGCRVFFGQNVLNLSQFLDSQHLNTILSKFRYEKDVYFGPESVQQIEVRMEEALFYHIASVEVEKNI